MSCGGSRRMIEGKQEADPFSPLPMAFQQIRPERKELRGESVRPSLQSTALRLSLTPSFPLPSSLLAVLQQNTGHPHPNLSSSQANSGGEGSGQEVGQSRGTADMDGPDGFADRAQPTDTSTGQDHGSGLAGQESLDGVGEKKSSVSAEGHGSHV